MKESDLYPFIKEYFTKQGYNVKAEIANCDIMAVKDDTIVITEMKTSLNLALLGQAVERQLLFDIVYIAVPKPKYKKRFSTQYKRTIKIVKRLNIGLLYVDMKEKVCYQELPPKIFKYGIKKSRKERLRNKAITEFDGLSGDYNIGGTTRVKRMTVYKESAIGIAMYLDKNGPTKASIMKDFGCGDKTREIMYNNYYGWFRMLGKGIYDITEAGRKALEVNKEICKVLDSKLFSDKE